MPRAKRTLNLISYLDCRRLAGTVFGSTSTLYPLPNIVHRRTIFRRECKSIGKPRSSALFVSLRIGRGLDYLPSFWIAHATQQLDQTEVISADKSQLEPLAYEEQSQSSGHSEIPAGPYSSERRRRYHRARPCA